MRDEGVVCEVNGVLGVKATFKKRYITLAPVAGVVGLAFKVKGPEKLALVTDAMRGMDMPDGHYVFGPKELDELVLKSNGVGLTLDGKALASAVAGMDEGFRNMVRATGAPLHVVAGMASLTPARIAGLDAEMGSLAVGKRADFVMLNDALQVCETWVDGARVYAA
jgi:N-acetylglucosamine-6-phosphate deacetylase